MIAEVLSGARQWTVLQGDEPRGESRWSFQGSSTLARRLGCVRECAGGYVGIELDKDWAEQGRERLAAEAEGSTLQARRAGQLPLLGGLR